ncbi:MAG: fibronectin type III domain-containing protein [bacterium]
MIVKIIEPASNTYLTGTGTVEIEVQDNESGIDKVDLWVGTNSDWTLGTDTSPGVFGTRTGNLVTTKYTDGSYNLYGVAIDQAGNIATSTLPYPITIDNTKPATPTLVSVTNPALSGRLNLSWTQGTDTNLAGYKVHIGSQSGSYTQTQDTGSTATSYQLTGLTNGTTYYIAISAYDKAGNESTKSNELFGTSTGTLAKIRIENQRHHLLHCYLCLR